MKAKLAPRPPARLAVQSRRPAERRPRDPRPPALDLHVVAGGLDASGVLRLQAAAGNQAVGQLLAQRAGEAAARQPLSVQAQAVDCPPAPPPLLPRSPEDSPRFQAVTGRVETEAGKLKSHPPARAKVAEAEQGAAGPANEVRSQAAKAQVDQMGQQKPKGFDKAAFIASVHAAIDRATPKTMTEVDDFTSSGKPGQLKEQVVGQVGEGKEAAGKGIKDATKAAPDLSKGSPKPVTPMKPEAPGPAPRDVGAAEATPLPLPAEQVSLQHGKCETSNQLAEAEVTEEQVQESNEPQFQDAMASKKEADQRADTAPGQFREEEQATLDAARGEAAQSATGALSQAHHSRVSGLGHVGSHKNDAKSKNEAERARVAREIEAIYGKTKADVEQTLNDLDGKVTKAFDDGEKGARDAFEGYYKTKKDAYFDDRYSGFWGWKRWLRDKIKGAPPEVNGFIVEAKNLYVSQMNQVIDRVATIVETELNRATARIQQGRDQITEYVAQQPKNLRRVAEEAGKKFASQFDDLDQSVNSKAGSLVEGLAQQYVAAAKKVDERCEEMREENKGLIDKIKDKIAGMIEAIKQMKELMSQIADRAAAVAGQIIRHPIRFLENLIDAVKQGFDLFTGNIEKHLKEGVISWLFGEVAKAGITLPTDFDLKGIITLIAQLLGLGWDAIRARAVAILGPKVVSLIEKGEAGVEKAVEVFNTIKTEGLGGVAHLMADKVGEVKDQALDFVKGMVITEVITAGVKWVLSLFNPVGAFIKACKAIYDIVMFFVHHASEIVDLVNSILDNLAAIVAGNIAAAAKLVEDSLAKAIPLVIGFLASLLGLGDFGGKIRGVIDKVRQPVNQAIDWVLGNVVKPMVGFVGKGAAWVGGKAKAGAAWVKGKAQQGAAWVKGKLRGEERPPPSPAARSAGVKAAVRQVLAGKVLHSGAQAHELLAGTYSTFAPHGLKSLELIPHAQGPTKSRVLISASIPVAVEMATDQKKVLRLLASLSYMTSRTFADVSYDDGRRWKRYTTKSDKAGHAERFLADDTDSMAAKIRAKRDKGKLKTPPGQPVPVIVEMNRLPCNHCFDRLLSAFGPHKDVLALTVVGASIYKQGTYEFTTPKKIQEMLIAGIEVKPLDVWPAAHKKLKEMGVKSVWAHGREWSLDGYVLEFDRSDEVREQLHKASGGVSTEVKHERIGD